MDYRLASVFLRTYAVAGVAVRRARLIARDRPDAILTHYPAGAVLIDSNFYIALEPYSGALEAGQGLAAEVVRLAAGSYMRTTVIEHYAARAVSQSRLRSSGATTS